jgi:PIN domain nuclease of toxin-antitoxin system
VNLLLDTHVLLKWLGDLEVAAEARAAIADPDNLVVVSAASVWEASVKRALGKLEAPEGLADIIVASGFEPLHITGAHAERAGGLPPHHHDPFDRMLVAQAQAEALTVVTGVATIESYDVNILRC